MSRPRKYKIVFVDDKEMETGYCKLRLSVKGDFLFQEDPSDYAAEPVKRTYPIVNIKYWEAID